MKEAEGERIMMGKERKGKGEEIEKKRRKESGNVCLIQACNG